MELRQLRYFLAIVDNGSLSKAAARLYVAQSALSHQIAKLEGELGTTLLYRSSKGVRITESGLAFYEHAQNILQQVVNSRSVVAQHAADTPVGTVTLGMPQSVSAVLALPLFLAARRELPRITLQMNDELTDNVLGQLRQGKLNLALLYDYGQLQEFARKNVITEQMFLVWPAQDARASADSKVKLSALQTAPLILPGAQYGVRQHIERTAAKHGFVFANIAAEINSLNIMKSAILAEIGAGVFPLSAVNVEIEQGKMRAQEIIEPGIPRTIAICASRDISMTKANRAVSKLIVRVVRRLCESGEWPGALPIFHHNAYLVES
jgi:LysR family nitrogen assimilation transcriptional regulator